MTVGEKIRHYRKEKNLTQKQLAALCGLSENVVRHYENGYRNPKIETIQKIAAALDVPVTELLDKDFHGTAAKEILEKMHRDLDVARLLAHKSRTGELTEIDKHIIDLQLFSDISGAGNDSDQDGQKELLAYYGMLNQDGKKEAVKRVGELTEIPKYKK